jgi:hypothetical protein
MTTYYLVACVSEKVSSCRPAEELYQSDWFRKARSYVIREMKSEDKWFILSAKYHLVSPRQPLEPYDETLKYMRKPERLRWARQVLEQLQEVLQRGDTVVILAGDRYREFLEPDLRSRGYYATVPMRGSSHRPAVELASE